MNGQQRAELAEIAALNKEVAKLKPERDILKKCRQSLRHLFEKPLATHTSRGSEGMTAIGPKECPNT
jgi:transposase-like protein